MIGCVVCLLERADDLGGERQSYPKAIRASAKLVSFREKFYAIR